MHLKGKYSDLKWLGRSSAEYEQMTNGYVKNGQGNTSRNHGEMSHEHGSAEKEKFHSSD